MSEHKGKGITFNFAKPKPTVTTNNAQITEQLFKEDDKKVIATPHVESIKVDEAEEDEPWLQAGLIVRIQNNSLRDGFYYGKTGIVKSVVEGGYGGEVHVDGDILKLDQDDCEAMLPLLGTEGIILKGEHRDLKVLIIRMGQDGLDVEVELRDGLRQGHRLLLPKPYICRHLAIERSKS